MSEILEDMFSERQLTVSEWNPKPLTRNRWAEIMRRALREHWEELRSLNRKPLISNRGMSRKAQRRQRREAGR